MYGSCSAKRAYFAEITTQFLSFNLQRNPCFEIGTFPALSGDTRMLEGLIETRLLLYVDVCAFTFVRLVNMKKVVHVRHAVLTMSD